MRSTLRALRCPRRHLGPSFDGLHSLGRSGPASRRSDGRRGGLLGGVVICLILAAVVGGVGYYFVYDNSDQVSQDSLIIEMVRRAPFDHIVLEQGEIESSSNIEVVCKVEARGGGGTSILWVIDEGAKVNKGDKLVELDASQLQVQLKDQRIMVVTSEAAVTSAQALVEQATIARQEYLEGVYLTEEKAILSEMAVNEQGLRTAQLALGSSERLVAKGLVKSLQLEADKFAVANSQNMLDAAKGRLRVLQNLTRKKMLVQFDSDINAAEAGLVAAQSKLDEDQKTLADYEKQIANCVITAPADGVVVHANRYSGRGGGAEFVVEAGAMVREKQAIVRLPDPSQMQVRCNVNESRVTLIQSGMASKIAVDALPGVQLKGRVVKVNRYAEPNSYFSSSIKEYATTVAIIDPPESIRTGMTSEVQIFVEQVPDALQIPIQGLYEHGDQMYSLVQSGPQRFETRAVTIGATNDKMATITEGLSENDKIVLNLRQHLNLMELPEVTAQDNSDMMDIAENGEPIAAGADGPSSPRGGPSGAGGAPGDGGPNGGEGGAPGGFGGGGGMPDIGTIVDRSMERSDTDGDGKISKDEISSVDENRQAGLTAADTDGDGFVTKAELMASIKKRMAEGGGGGR